MWPSLLLAFQGFCIYGKESISPKTKTRFYDYNHYLSSVVFYSKYVGIMNGIVLMMGNGISPCYFTFLRGGSHHQ